MTFRREGNEVVISQEGKSVTKRFDNYGRPTVIIDDNGSYSYFDYKNSTDGEPTVSALRASGGNLLTNGGFENGLPWATFLEQNKREAIMAEAGMKVTETIKDKAFASAILPIDAAVLSMVSFITAAPLNRYVKSRRKFIDNSQAVLRAIRGASDPIFCYALGTILWMGVQYLPEHRENVYTVYKGDTEITVLC